MPPTNGGDEEFDDFVAVPPVGSNHVGLNDAIKAPRAPPVPEPPKQTSEDIALTKLLKWAKEKKQRDMDAHVIKVTEQSSIKEDDQQQSPDISKTDEDFGEFK